MIIEMFNFWYFFWIIVGAGAIVGLYFGLRHTSDKVKKIVLFSMLVLGLVLHFLKVYIPPYSLDEARLLRDAWFVNICGANIAVFPFLFWSKNKSVKDYMFYIGVLTGLLVFIYPQEPLAKTNQLGETLDILRFYYHHWMLIAVPLLMVLLKIHTLSYKRILSAPIGLLILMLFIILNQIFQSELGYIPLRSAEFFDINYKNSSYIWGPDNDAIGNFFAIFCPKFFKTIPVGAYAGQEKYWPWFWLIFPVFTIVTPLTFGLAMIFDHKNFVKDWNIFWNKVRVKFKKANAKDVTVNKNNETILKSNNKSDEI